MATINFYLKDTTSKKPTPVNLVFYYGKPKPFKYAVGISVHPDDWSFTKQRVRDKKGLLDTPEKNRLISLIASSIERIYTDLLSRGVNPENDDLKHELDIALKRKEKSKETEFMDYMEFCVTQKKANKSTDWGLASMAQGCIKRYCQTKKITILFKDIDMSFKQNFCSFIDSEINKSGEPRYAQNGKVGILAGLKAILSSAQNDGLNPYNYFRSFNVSPEKVKKFSHTHEELLRIYNLDLSKHRKMYNDVRDSFIIGSCTAMRVSDYSTLGKENIEDGLIFKTTQKTGAHVVVPLHWMVEETLKKRNGAFPDKVTTTAFNRIIKKICEMAKLDDMIMTSQTRGGVLINKVVKKANLMQSHTARRHGIRQMLAAGIPKGKIMPMSGHATESAFDRYADVDVENNAREYKNHAFFKKPNPEVPESNDTAQS